MKTLSPDQRVEHLQKIQSAYSKCKEYSDDKVQLAMQTYEMVRSGGPRPVLREEGVAGGVGWVGAALPAGRHPLDAPTSPSFGLWHVALAECCEPAGSLSSLGSVCRSLLWGRVTVSSPSFDPIALFLFFLPSWSKYLRASEALSVRTCTFFRFLCLRPHPVAFHSPASHYCLPSRFS